MIRYLNTYYIIMIITCSACSQTKDKNNIEEMAVKIDTYINNILKSVDHPSEETIYTIDTYAPGAKYDIEVNNMPIINRYDIEDSGAYIFKKYFSLNEAMGVKSTHTVTYKMTPLNKDRFEDYDINDITIDSRSQFKNSKEIFLFEPQIKEVDDEQLKEYIGNDVYNGSFTFTSKLPYEKSIDWSHSEDLRTINNIEEEVLDAFKEIMRLYSAGDSDNLLKLYKPILTDKAQSYFASKENLRKTFVKRLHPFFYKSQPKLNDYNLKFYANGRLVTLEKKKDTDEPYNKSALSIVYDKDFDKFPDSLYANAEHLEMFEKGTIPKMEMELYLFFYKPKGSKTLKLATDIYREEKLLNPTE